MTVQLNPGISVYQPYIKMCGTLPRISKWFLCLVAQHKYVFRFIFISVLYKTKCIELNIKQFPL
jgi:hypothetical protein